MDWIFGFKVVVAPGIADIFYNNCIKNGMLPVVLSDREVDSLFAQPGLELTADLENQRLTDPNGRSYAFEIGKFAKHCLLKGLDQIGWTLQLQDKISAYEQQLAEQRPWMDEA